MGLCLLHFPDTGSLPDAVFWTDGGELRSKVAVLTPEVMQGRAVLYQKDPSASWERYFDALADSNSQPESWQTVETVHMSPEELLAMARREAR